MHELHHFSGGAWVGGRNIVLEEEMLPSPNSSSFLKKVFIEFVAILLLFYVLVFLTGGKWDHSSLTRD